MMKRAVTFVLILFTIGPVMSSQLLFDCQTPFDPFDPNFQQGSETFLAIRVNSEKKLTLSTSKFGTRESSLYNGDSSPFHLGSGSSSLTARFNSGYLSMVYLGVSGGKNKWGAFVKDGEFEEEFFCFEKLDLLSL